MNKKEHTITSLYEERVKNYNKENEDGISCKTFGKLIVTARYWDDLMVEHGKDSDCSFFVSKHSSIMWIIEKANDVDSAVDGVFDYVVENRRFF